MEPDCLWSSAQLGGSRDFWSRDGTEELERGQSLSTLAFKELKVSVKWDHRGEKGQTQP